MRFDTVSFLSDLGTTDEFVGIVHSVVRSTAPGVAVIDLSHAIARHDVRAAGLLLARAAQYLCAGVVIAAVDPGAGTDRRAIAVEVGAGASVLLGPDNGVLAPAVALVGGADRAVILNNVSYHLPSVGAGCAARDVFAPVAGHLCLGVPFDDLGDAVDTVSLRPAVVPLTRVEDGVLQAEVLWVDHFGNAQLNVDPDEIAGYGDLVEVSVGAVQRAARRVGAYEQLGTGEVGLLVDSYGLVSVVLDRASAAEELRLDAGAGVALRAVPDEGRPAGASSPVSLRPRSS